MLVTTFAQDALDLFPTAGEVRPTGVVSVRTYCEADFIGSRREATGELVVSILGESGEVVAADVTYDQILGHLKAHTGCPCPEYCANEVPWMLEMELERDWDWGPLDD